MKRSNSILQQFYMSQLPKAQTGRETPGWFSQVGKDLRNLFGIEEEKPEQVVLKMPQKIRIQDTRTKSLTTGQKINPNRDLVSGEYPSNRIYNIVKAAKRYGIDPYDALAIDLQETGLGTSKREGNENVGHILMNRWNDRLVSSKSEEMDDPSFQPYDTFGQVLATKMQEADRLGITDPYTRLQVYNGLGKISGHTEKDYHGFKMKSIYGVPIPAEGIDMRKNPLYGKRVVDLRDNVLKSNKDLEYWIRHIKKTGGPIVDPRGQWAYPGRDTIVPTASGGITMQDVPYPVYGEDETGYGQMMMPGGEYQFPGQMVYEKPMMESGGQHGGLDRWFAEKWVDVKTGKACGRQEGEKRRSYPACRPSRRVNEDTPKTSGELSSSEREKFKRSKTSSERINYQHRRKEYGGETNEQDMANKPNNPSLWSKAKSLAKQKFDVYPSAYANGWAAKWYKGKGGTWRKAEYGMQIPYMEDGGKPEWLIEAQLEAQGYSGDALQQKMSTMAQGGEPQNEGFQALPEEVQRKIMEAAFGGYIPEMMFGGPAQQTAIDRLQKREEKLVAKGYKAVDEGREKKADRILGRAAKVEDRKIRLMESMSYGGDIPEMAYGGAAQQAAIAIAMKKAGKKPKMPFGGLLLPGIKKRIEEAKPMLMQMAPMLMGAPPMPMMAKGGDPDGEMALGQIDAAIMKLEQLRKFIQPDSDLEPWVNSKLTLMDDYASAVSDYMMFNPENQEQMPEMGRGGYTVTRSNDRKGKTHKVTGPDGTVKYFGDSKLGQHPKDPERKKAFYARHKKNLDANPYFRAFARATWRDGGELPLKKGGSTFSGNAFYEMGGPAVGDEMEVTPEQLQMLKDGGYTFEII
jgi:hypothetical protein